MSANIPHPVNEPVLNYAPGSPERAALEAALKELGSVVTDIPVVINGREYRESATVKVTSPQRHAHHLATTHLASAELLNEAIRERSLPRRNGRTGPSPTAPPSSSRRPTCWPDRGASGSTRRRCWGRGRRRTRPRSTRPAS